MYHDLDVKLIGTTIIDWKSFSGQFEKYLEVNPIRDLDAKGIKTKSLNAFLSYSGKPGLLHHFLNFICIGNQNLIIDCQRLGLFINEFEVSRDTFLLILSGSIGTWFSFFEAVGSDFFKSLQTQVYNILRQTDLNVILKEYYDITEKNDFLIIKKRL